MASPRVSKPMRLSPARALVASKARGSRLIREVESPSAALLLAEVCSVWPEPQKWRDVPGLVRLRSETWKALPEGPRFAPTASVSLSARATRRPMLQEPLRWRPTRSVVPDVVHASSCSREWRGLRRPGRCDRRDPCPGAVRAGAAGNRGGGSCSNAFRRPVQKSRAACSRTHANIEARGGARSRLRAPLWTISGITRRARSE